MKEEEMLVPKEQTTVRGRGRGQAQGRGAGRGRKVTAKVCTCKLVVSCVLHSRVYCKL